MTYQDTVPEINAICMAHPGCWHMPTAEVDCPYVDVCRAEYKGPNGGNAAFETAVLARYMELRSGKPQKKFYFTFGSDPKFPYQNTFLIVIAETEKSAIEKFRAKFPDRHKDTVNCAFWYSEERWHGSQNETGYGDPAEVIA